MPRLFTGLAVPAEIAEALKVYQGGLPGARWIEPSDFHVTLRFLGDVEATVADDVVEAFQTARNSQESGKVVVSLWLDDEGQATA